MYVYIHVCACFRYMQYIRTIRNTHNIMYIYTDTGTCLCLRTANRSRKTRVFEYRDCGVGWGGGMLTFLVLRT